MTAQALELRQALGYGEGASVRPRVMAHLGSRSHAHSKPETFARTSARYNM